MIELIWKPALIWFGSLAATIAFIRSVTKDADVDLNPEKRTEIAGRLLKFRAEKSNPDWIPDFNLVFDHFFGKNHLSWRCFRKAALISIISYVLLFLFFAFIGPDEEPRELNLFLLIALAILPAVLYNVPIDYLSLLETRIILGSKLSTFWKIPIDFALTFALWVLWMTLISPDGGGTFEDRLQILFGSLNSKFSPSWASFATTYTTSIWFWLHGVSRLLILTSSGIKTVMNSLDVEAHPVRAIGVAICFLTLAGGSLLFPLFIVFW